MIKSIKNLLNNQNMYDILYRTCYYDCLIIRYTIIYGFKYCLKTYLKKICNAIILK